MMLGIATIVKESFPEDKKVKLVLSYSLFKK